MVKGLHYLFVGVDPGFTGAIATLEDIEGTETAFVWDMPTRDQGGRKRIDRDRATALVRSAYDDFPGTRIVAAVEAVGAMAKKRRKEGTASMFRFGQGQGEVLGILTALGAMVFEVPPAIWKAKAGLIHMDEKDVCKRALELFPYQELFGPRGGALHGRAEALFLAAYARMITEGRAIDDR